jgi:hypothetical protein
LQLSCGSSSAPKANPFLNGNSSIHSLLPIFQSAGNKSIGIGILVFSFVHLYPLLSCCQLLLLSHWLIAVLLIVDHTISSLKKEREHCDSF